MCAVLVLSFVPNGENHRMYYLTIYDVLFIWQFGDFVPNGECGEERHF